MKRSSRHTTGKHILDRGTLGELKDLGRIKRGPHKHFGVERLC